MVMVTVAMMIMVLMVGQCTQMSGNNAISCEKFTDASSPRLHFHHHRYHHQGKPTKRNVSIWAFYLLILLNIIESGDFNMPFFLLRIERKHILTHTHISHW